MSIKTARQKFRKEIQKSLESGVVDRRMLEAQAMQFFTKQINVDTLFRALSRSETNNALSTLRANGSIEAVGGKKWKAASEVTAEEAEGINYRRFRTIAGELKTQIEFSTRHGRTEDAAIASEMLGAITPILKNKEAEVEQELTTA